MKQFSAFLPLTLFGLAFIVLLGNEIITLRSDIEATNTTITERTDTAAQAERHFHQLQQLVGEIIALGESDETAARIVRAYNLQSATQSQ